MCVLHGTGESPSPSTPLPSRERRLGCHACYWGDDVCVAWDRGVTLTPVSSTGQALRQAQGRLSILSRQGLTRVGKQNRSYDQANAASACHSERSEESRVPAYGRRCLAVSDLRFFTPLRFVQNDSAGVVFSSMASGPIVKYLPLSARQGRGGWDATPAIGGGLAASDDARWVGVVRSTARRSPAEHRDTRLSEGVWEPIRS